MRAREPTRTPPHITPKCSGWNPGDQAGPQLVYICSFTLNNAPAASLRVEFFGFDTEKEWDLFSVTQGSSTLFPATSGNPALPSLTFTTRSTSLFFNFSYDIDTNRTGVWVRVTAAAPSPSQGVTPSSTGTPRPTPSPSQTPVYATNNMFCSSTVNSVVFAKISQVEDVSTNAGALTGSANYRNSENCAFFIDNQYAQMLRIDFIAFRTESSRDLMRIYDSYIYTSSPSSNANLRLSWSGSSKPPSITTNSRYIYFSFISDNSNAYPGVYMRVGPVGLLPSAAPFPVAVSSSAKGLDGGSLAGIIVGVIFLCFLLSLFVCIKCCGSIGAGLARISTRSGGSSVISSGGGTTIIMNNPAQPAFNNPIGYPPPMPMMQPVMQPVMPAFAPTPVYPMQPHYHQQQQGNYVQPQQMNYAQQQQGPYGNYVRCVGPVVVARAPAPRPLISHPLFAPRPPPPHPFCRP